VYKCIVLCPIGDTVCNLGIAMDELMRHQPSLKTSVIAALIEVHVLCACVCVCVCVCVCHVCACV